MNQAAPLVLLHGWGMNPGVWNALRAHLPPGRPVQALALPGHGAVPFDPARASLTDWADACLAAAPPRAPWIGWSLGGLVALAAALRAPGRVAGLVLIGATPRFAQASDWPDAMPPDRLAAFHADLRADPAATLSRFLALQMRGGAGARDSLRQIRRDLAAHPAPAPAALAAGLALLSEEDLRDRLTAIACPATWLFGDHDTLVPVAAAAAIARRMPATRIRVIAGAAHAPHLSHPRETAAVILDQAPLR